MNVVYILLSLKDNRTYVGSTGNLERRIKEHKTGQVKSTRHRRPLKIILIEKFESLQIARQREIWWKSSVGRRRMKKLFQ